MNKRIREKKEKQRIARTIWELVKAADEMQREQEERINRLVEAFGKYYELKQQSSD